MGDFVALFVGRDEVVVAVVFGKTITMGQKMIHLCGRFLVFKFLCCL